MTAEILARIDTLERVNRRLRRAGACILLLVGAALLVGATRANRTLEAEEFILRNTAGKTRAWLTVSKDDDANLLLFDRNNNLRAVLQATDGATGGPRFILYGANRKEGAEIALAVQGASLIRLFDQNEKTRVSLGVTPDGSVIAVSDVNEQGCVTLSGGATEPPAIYVFDAKGKVTWKAP